MKYIISKIMSHSTIKEKPPVLVDIGASGGPLQVWKSIAPYSICIAFDADTRDFIVSESSDKGYKKLYLLNRLVSTEADEALDFYLTHSPYCSSALKPNNEALEPWEFRRLFDVEKKVKVAAVDLWNALKTCGVDYVDWYKTDTQGTDLRIFNAMPKEVTNSSIIAEFEPGIIDAYVGEDKLHHLLSYMDDKIFWVSSMKIKGSQRIDQEDMALLNFYQRKRIDVFLKAAPGWCEIAFINKFGSDNMGLREYLLGWLFSSIKGEHGFALRLARIGKSTFGDPLFDELMVNSVRALSNPSGYLRVAFKKLNSLSQRLVTLGRRVFALT